MRRLALAALVLVVALGIALSSLGPRPSLVSAAAPTVNGVSPNTGPVAGGTTVTVTGSGFTSGCGGVNPTSVTFGGATAGILGTPLPTDSQVTVTSPASPLPSPGTGTVDVVVSCSGSSAVTSLDKFTYTTTGGGGSGNALFNGSTFFVSTTGSDNNPCSSTLPCATISAAVNQTRDGDLVVVLSGTYDVAAPIEVPDLIAIEAASTTATTAPLTNLSITGSTALGGSTSGTCIGQGSGTKTILRSANGEPIFHVTAVGFPDRAAAIFGFILGGTTDFANPGAVQLDGASYAQVLCNTIGQEDLPNVIGVLLKDADNVAVHDNTIHGSTQFPISPVLGPTPPVGGFGVVTSECLGDGHSNDDQVFSNLLAYNSNAGVFFCSDGAGGHLIVNNTVRNNGRGIVLRDVNDSVVAANAVQDNYYDGIEVLATSSDNIITNNSIEGQDGPNSTGALLEGDGLLFPLDNVFVANFFRRNNDNIMVVGARRTLIGVDKTVINSLEGTIGPAGHIYLVTKGNVMSADGNRTDIVLSLGNPSGGSLNSASPSFGQPSDTIISQNTILSNGPCNANDGCAIRLTAGVTINIAATGNEWGVTGPDEIRAMMWDKSRDAALGQVLFYDELGTPVPTPTQFPIGAPPYTYPALPFGATPVQGAGPVSAAASYPARPAPGSASAPPPPTAYIDPASGNYYVELTLCVTNASNAAVASDQLSISVYDSGGNTLGLANVITASTGCFAGDIAAARGSSGSQPASLAITDSSGAVTNLPVGSGSPLYRTPASAVTGS